MEAFRPRNILCAVDLGPTTPNVLAWAGRLATIFGGQLDILHAHGWELPEYFTATQMEQLLAEIRRARKKLEEHLSKLAKDATGGRIAVRVHVVEAPPVDAILERAKQWPADLVVVGSHGRTGLARFVLGSVSESILHHSSVPTLVVRNQPPASGARLLCPVTLTPESLGALEIAAEVAQKLQAELDVLHVVEADGADLQAERARLCEAVPESARQRCTLREQVRSGRPAEQIVLAAREIKADLIVLAAARRSFLEWTALGITTDRILRYSPCSVLVLPSAATDPGTPSPGLKAKRSQGAQ
jgi:nucleotide-binding universal stress UspA family protein